MTHIEVFNTGPLGVNTLIVPIFSGAKNVFVVDVATSSATGDENCVRDFLAKEGLSPIAVCLTHGHFDHVVGLKTIRTQFPQIPIFIGKDDADFIGATGEKLQKKFLELTFCGGAFESQFENMPCANDFFTAGKIFYDFWGDGFFKDLDEKSLDALKNWKAISTPGHSAGSFCFYNEAEKILISGDTLFYGSHGRTDFPGGSERKMKHSLEMLSLMIDGETRVFPGHDRFDFAFREAFSW